MAKDVKVDAHEAKAHDAAAPKPTKEQLAATLLALYEQRMDSASPRTREELDMLRELVAK